MARFGESMDRFRITIRCTWIDIGVRANMHGRAAVAEVPSFTHRRGLECSDLEGDWIARADLLRRCVARMNRGRKLAVALAVDDQDNSEVVIDASLTVDDLQDLAVFAGLTVESLDSRPRCSLAVRER